LQIAKVSRTYFPIGPIGDKTKHAQAEKLRPADPHFQGLFAIFVGGSDLSGLNRLAQGLDGVRGLARLAEVIDRCTTPRNSTTIFCRRSNIPGSLSNACRNAVRRCC
jgi:hypothetical protein